ncbi:MAG: ArsR family transcriptional regulator [Candidatus Omnitrophota bacterium]
MSDFLKLTKSDLRRRVLLYFFTNPDEDLYLREIADILKIDPGNLSRELERLRKEGIFNSRERGNQKYFALNKRHPLYGELRSVVFKTIGIEGWLKKIIGGIKKIEIAAIYGSFASGHENSKSDIDILIIGDPDQDDLMEKIEKVEKDVAREINYNIYSLDDFSERVKKKDSFIRNILKGPKIILKGRLNEIQRLN